MRAASKNSCSPADGFVARLPKVHLHCHLEGTVRATTFLELADRDGVPLRYRPDGKASEPPRTADRAYAFADFQEFLYLFAAVSRALRTPADYARIAREFAGDALAQNVVYGELFVSPPVWRFFHPELDVREALAAIREGLQHVAGGRFTLIYDIPRNFGPQAALAAVREATRLAGEGGIIGVGLGGDEVRFPPSLFHEAFAAARAEGLHRVAHAGEAAGARSVRDAVEILGAERIGHGIRVVEDPGVVQLLRERGIPLEVCPTSNERTGVVRGPAEDVLGHLFDTGLRVLIDADDPALFATTITDEYRRVSEAFGAARVVECVRTAIDASFADPAEKATMRAVLEASVAKAGVPEYAAARAKRPRR
jgi:adenosine deaminase